MACSVGGQGRWYRYDMRVANEGSLGGYLSSWVHGRVGVVSLAERNSDGVKVMG